MELSEAIKHCKEKADEMRISADLCNLGTEMQTECIKCAEQHEQLAEWLTELKEWRENREDRGSCKCCKYRAVPMHKEPCKDCEHSHDNMFEFDKEAENEIN